MRHLSVLIPQGDYNLSGFIMTLEAFNMANDHCRLMGKNPGFTIQVVGKEHKSLQYNNRFAIQPDIDFKELKKTDLIIISAVGLAFDQYLEANEALIHWITKQYKSGAEIGSLCTGAFLLAFTGLLDGKQCSTHWNASNEFRRVFPGIDLMDEKIITEHNGIYTSGGALSCMNLVLHLIEKYYSRETAIYVAKCLEIDINRNTQSPFAIFQGQKTHGDTMVQKAQDYIENNIDSKISVEDLAEKFTVGRRHFERRFKKATNNTPIEYIQRVKIETAKKRLEAGQENINEVMYSIGYADITAFRSIFKKITGLTPMAYRNKYNREFALDQ